MIRKPGNGRARAVAVRRSRRRSGRRRAPEPESSGSVLRAASRRGRDVTSAEPSYEVGSTSRNFAPCGSAGSYVRVPPCARANDCAIERPSPAPSLDSVGPAGEPLEEAADEFLRNSLAAVLDRHLELVARPGRRDDDGRRPVPEGVGEQVRHDPVECLGVDDGVEAGGNIERHAVRRPPRRRSRRAARRRRCDSARPESSRPPDVRGRAGSRRARAGAWPAASSIRRNAARCSGSSSASRSSSVRTAP